MTIALAALLTFGLVSATAFGLASLQRWADVDWWIVPINVALLFILQIALTAYGPITSFMQSYELEIHCSIVLMPIFYYALIGCDYVALAKRRRSDLKSRFTQLGPVANVFGNPLRPWSCLTYNLYYDATSRLNKLGHQVERKAGEQERLKAIRQFSKLARENYADLCRKRSQHSFLNERGMLEDGLWANDARDFIVDVGLPYIHQHNQRLPLTVDVLASLLNELIIPAGMGPESDEMLSIEHANVAAAIEPEEDKEEVAEHDEEIVTLLRAAG
jgi:hypothetical protein